MRGDSGRGVWESLMPGIMERLPGDAKSNIRGVRDDKAMQSSQNKGSREGSAEVSEPIERIEACAAGDELLVVFVEGSRESECENGAGEETESSSAERAFQSPGKRAGAPGKKNEVKKFVLVGNESRHVLGWRGAREEKQNR